MPGALILAVFVRMLSFSRRPDLCRLCRHLCGGRHRLLWAVSNGARWTASQVRPHELLNYFSFDTVKPTPAQVFDVQISAEQHGETLAVAMAVKGSEPEPMPLDLTMIVDVSCSMADAGRMDARTPA